MAQIANLTEPYTVAAVEEVQPIPIGALKDDAYVAGAPTGLSPPYLITNRFPTPPAALAFLTNPFEEDPEEVFMAFDGLVPPYNIVGAVYPASQYLEPTIGQIWPR